MANLTVYLLESSDSKSVDRHLRFPGKLLRPCPTVYAAVFRFCAENVPNFRAMADFSNYAKLLQGGAT
jgi:hypothetical protein